MKKVVSLIVVLLLVAGNLTAKKVDQSTALKVATNFAVKSSVFKSVPTLELIYVATGEDQSNLRSAGSPLFYIYNISQENGFVIISGDDITLPVLGYSETGSFRAENMPDNVREWLAFYEKEINYVITSGVTASESTTQQWNNLLTGIVPKSTAIVELSTVEWDQSAPYNNFCPMDGTKHSVSGCVATAMGIIMKYYQWPGKGIGHNSYTTATKKIAVSANFDVAYDWSNMLNSYSGIFNATQATAVSTLIYHAAVATNMDFTATSSGAYTTDAVSAFVNNFGYDNSIYLTASEFYTLDEWHTLLQNELNNNRLIMYGGNTDEDESKGHQFVFDGYNDRNYYHINWGWGSIANGYYLLSSLEPKEQGIGGSTSGADFSRSQEAVIGIQKPQEGSAAGNELIYYPQTGITYTGINTTADKIVQDEPFKITFTLIGDYGMKAFDGKIGFFLTDKNGTLKENLGSGDVDIPAQTGIFNKAGIELTIKGTVSTGDKVAIYYTTDGTNWKKVRALSGAVTELMAGDLSIVANEIINAQSDINVFPTVAETEVTIQSTGDAFVEKVLVFDLTGRLMKEQRFSTQEFEVTLDVSGLKQGVHILSVQTSKGYSQYKIIKK